MANQDLKENVLLNLRSVTQSCKGGVPFERLQRDYKDLLGSPIPFRDLGYHSLEAFIRDIPHVISIRKNSDGQLIAEGVADASTAHIVSLVSRQRADTKKRTFRKPPPYGGMRRTLPSRYTFREGSRSSHSNYTSPPIQTSKNSTIRSPKSKPSKPPTLAPHSKPYRAPPEQVPSRKYEVAPRFLKLKDKDNGATQSQELATQSRELASPSTYSSLPNVQPLNDSKIIPPPRAEIIPPPRAEIIPPPRAVGRSLPIKPVENYRALQLDALESARVLNKENSRLRLAANSRAKDRFITGVSDKYSLKYKPIVELVGCADPKKITKMWDSSSNWKSIRGSRSHVKPHISGLSHLVRSPGRRQSINPVKRSIRRHLKSPVRRIESPLMQVIRTPLSRARRYSRSSQRRNLRSPIRQKSRSPYRKISKNLIKRKSRSPIWKISRSPIRRKSRSPLRQHSRNSFRRHCRSPLQLYSRHPWRQHSRSPLGYHRRSPLRYHSRSPLRSSRNPLRQGCENLTRQHSRSPLGRHSRNLIRRRSRSPHRRHSRTPVQRISSPLIYQTQHKMYSHNIAQSGSSWKHNNSDERYSNCMHYFQKHLGVCEPEFSKIRGPSRSNVSDKFKSHIFPSSSIWGVRDLDPVREEYESVYFNDKHQRVQNAVSSSISKMVLPKLLQKFSTTDASASDPALNKLMWFMEAHRTELEELVELQSASKSSKMNFLKVDSSQYYKNNARFYTGNY